MKFCQNLERLQVLGRIEDVFARRVSFSSVFHDLPQKCALCGPLQTPKFSAISAKN